MTIKAKAGKFTHEATYPDGTPDLVVPPGEFLQEEIAARKMSQRALAQAMGREPKVISEIIHARKQITPETALQLEAALGIAAGLWVRMEADYRLHLARVKQGKAAATV